MSQDFYANDHKIKVGFSGSGSGILDILSEDSMELNSENNLRLSGGSSSIYVNNDIEISSNNILDIFCSNINVASLTLSSISLKKNVLVDQNLNVDGNIDIDGTLDCPNISRHGSISIEALVVGLGDSDINISANDSIDISAGDNLNISCENAEISCDNNDAAGPILSIINNSSHHNADGIKIVINQSGLTANNKWIDFRSSDADSKGCIRAAPPIPDNYVLISNLTGTIQIAQNASANMTTSAGDVQFVSGANDFGEWIEIANPREWSDNYIDYVNGNILSIEEGSIVYIKESKAWKNNLENSTPMIVTHRAVLIGNYKDGIKKIGVVVSFMGQVPVIIKGPVSEGDYLIPENNYCIPVPSSDISFEQYKKSIGIAWGSSSIKEMKKVNCAIGKK